LARLEVLLNKPKISVDQVAAVLASDMVISASIMRAVSSARYITSEPAQTLTDAVGRLGFGDVRAIAYAAVYMSGVSPTKNVSRREFWTSAFVSAVAARELAIHLNGLGRHQFDPATAFLLGLSHDIGILVLDIYSSNLYRKVMEQSQFNPSALSRHEKDFLGINHGVAGAVLMKVWGLPESWIMAVAGHSFPARLPREFQPWADLLLIAESMAFYLGYSNGASQLKKPEMIPELVSQRLQHMHFDQEACFNLASVIQQKLEYEDWLSLVADLTQ
jgi:HD-like signal output (HDOD) protein